MASNILLVTMRLVSRINCAAYLPALGLIMTYGYLPLVWAFGTSNEPIFRTDPKAFGLLLFYYYSFSRNILFFLILSAVPTGGSIIWSIYAGMFSQLSKIALIQFVMTILLYFVLFSFDPRGYLFWYFD